MEKFEVIVQHWGYEEHLTVEAESKYLALARARELRRGLDCRLPKEEDDKRRARPAAGRKGPAGNRP